MKEILVLVDTSTASQQRVELAKTYTERLSGHLSGLILLPEPELVQYAEEEMFPDIRQQYFEQYATELNVRLAEAEKQFQQSVTDLTEDASCTIEKGDADEILLGYARLSDFIILGQHNPEYRGDPIHYKPDDVILHSGRPVIVVPYVKCATDFPKHIMVAWDGSREATRAVYDAMPLLKLAESVELCSVEESKSTSARHAGANAMLIQLRRHNIAAEARHLIPGSLSIGNTLLNHITDSGTDMLVAGAYGHSRMWETMLGGVTRDLLTHCSVPLLMSN